MRTRQKQRIIIGALCTVIIGLAVGYAVLSQNLNIQGTSGITSDFNIVFTNIEEINQMPESGDMGDFNFWNDIDNGILAFLGTVLGNGGVTQDITTLKAQVVNEHQIDLNVDMKKPGAVGVYEITVENTGKLDGYISDITGLEEANTSEPTDIQFSLYNFKENQKIRVGEVKKFVLVVAWSKEATTIPQTSKNLTLDLTVTQYSPQEQDRPDIPEPSGKTEYAVGDEVYFDPVVGQRCYSDEAWTLDDKGSTCYKWNVIKASDSSSDTVELLLDHNLPEEIAWVSLEDYKAAGGTDEEYNLGGVETDSGFMSVGNNKYGPLTALKYLKQSTAGWNGVVTLTSADNVTRNNASGSTYTINYEGYKARLISGQEIADIAGDQEWTSDSYAIFDLPSWLWSNTFTDSDSLDTLDIYIPTMYWTDTAHFSYTGNAWWVSQNFGADMLTVSGVKGAYPRFGVRPVVRILKSNL